MLVMVLNGCSGWAVDTVAAAHDLRPKKNVSTFGNTTLFNMSWLTGRSGGGDGTMLMLWPRSSEQMPMRAKDLLSLHEPADPDGWVRVAVGERRRRDEFDPLLGQVTEGERLMVMSTALSLRLLLWALALGVLVLMLRGGVRAQHRGIMRGVSMLLLKKPPRGAPSAGFERMEYARPEGRG